MTMRDLLPPPMHPNKIEAAVIDMRNKGQFYVPQLGGPPISIYDWRDQELKRWENVQSFSGHGEKAGE